MKRRAIILSLAAACAVSVSLATGGVIAAPAAVKCQGSFTVLHNDRIGSVPFPAGPYSMTATTITCAQASNLFRAFLQDWDGKLPSGWRVALSGSTRNFTRAASTDAFTATPQTKPTPGPAPIPPTPTPSSLTCPGTFQVLHNDRVGAMILPAGSYRITRLSSGALSCAQASRWFAYFLNNSYQGNLPKPWTMNATTKTFYDGSSTNGFRVARISGLGEMLGWYPGAGEDTCHTNYEVPATEDIGGLTVPQGPYVLTAVGTATCPAAVAAANRIFAQGYLPAHWTVNPATGTFKRRGTDFGFRLDPLFSVSAFTG